MNNFLNRRKKSLMWSKSKKRIWIWRKRQSLWKGSSTHYKQKLNKNKCNLTLNLKTGTNKFVQKLKWKSELTHKKPESANKILWKFKILKKLQDKRKSLSYKRLLHKIKSLQSTRNIMVTYCQKLKMKFRKWLKRNLNWKVKSMLMGLK